jgi:hypothetical protein
MSSKVKPGRARLTWLEIIALEVKYKGNADVKKLIKHIRFIEHLLGKNPEQEKINEAVKEATVLAWQKAAEAHAIDEPGDMSFEEFCLHQIGMATMDFSKFGQPKNEKDKK